jgi:hypothetical protein
MKTDKKRVVLNLANHIGLIDFDVNDAIISPGLLSEQFDSR